MQDRFLTAPVAEWVARLGPAGVPACPVNDLPHALASPVTAERGLLVDGFLRLPVDSGARAAFDPPPALGADTRDVLAEAGFNAEEIDAVLSASTPSTRIPRSTGRLWNRTRRRCMSTLTPAIPR